MVEAATAYVGRFAPSPSGPLHFGSLVAAMASYVDARAHGGRWLLRIEDVDTPRCSIEAERHIRQQLSAYGFEHDGEVWRQSERAEAYEAALARLRQEGHVFACNCTRRMLEQNPLSRHNQEGELIYPGTCRHQLTAPPRLAHALRLRVIDNASAQISFTDRSCGLIEQNVAGEVGDFVVRRADDLYAYQLAVVVDDAAQRITDVVRGADLLLNTPRQIFLQHALDYSSPRYLHVPLVRNGNGEKLSKQTRAAAIALDNVVPTLEAAWAFLGQTPLGRFNDVADFWNAAVASWKTPQAQQ